MHKPIALPLLAGVCSAGLLFGASPPLVSSEPLAEPVAAPSPPEPDLPPAELAPPDQPEPGTAELPPPGVDHPLNPDAPLPPGVKDPRTAEEKAVIRKKEESKKPAIPDDAPEPGENEPSSSGADPAIAQMEKETKRLAAENALDAERTKRETAGLRAEVARLKLEKERLTEILAIDDLNRKASNREVYARQENEKERLTLEATLAKTEAEKLTSELKARQAEWQLMSAKLEAEIKDLKTERKRDNYADNKPVYLNDPLRDGELVISDRRIELNGPVTYRTADHVTTRINYFNNKDSKLPIFIVIDDSPGGSVMAGYRILKAMEGSSSPVYVVVKSFAASMAATIATLAEKSYAYPNALILHHQLSMRLFMANLNLVEQKELLEESNKWWERLAQPIADKMGVTLEEFIEQMYENSSSGDWSEFADEAQKLKWVDHIVTRMHETSLVKNPDARSAGTTITPRPPHGLAEELDEEGQPVMFLPRLNPRDFYFLYNPDSYYQLR